MAQGQFLPHPDNVEDVFFEDTAEKTESEKKIDDFANAMRDTGADSEVIVKLQRGTGKEPMEHVGYFSPDEYTYGQLIEHLKNTYGGGLYRFYLREGGRNKQVQAVRIAQAVQREEGINGHNNTHSDMHYLARMMEQQTRMLIEAIGNNQNEDAMLDRFIKYQTLFSGNKGNALGELKDAMQTLEAIGVQVGGPKEDEGFGPLLDKLGSVIEYTVQNPSNNATQNSRQQKRPDMNAIYRMKLAPLLKAAEKNSDPGVYASLIVDQFTPEKINQFFADENALEKIMAIEPKFAHYQPWLVQVGEHIKAIFGMDSTVSGEYVAEDLTTSTQSSTTPPHEVTSSATD